MRHLDSPAIDKKEKKGMEEEHSKEEQHGNNHGIPRKCNVSQGKEQRSSWCLSTLHEVWEGGRDIAHVLSRCERRRKTCIERHDKWEMCCSTTPLM